MRTNTTRFVAVTAIALAVGGTALGTAAIANAGTMPTDGPTVAMTITNNTDNPMLLDSASNPYGQWINGPRSYLAPHTTEIVTAYSSDPRGIGVDVTYNVADGVQTVMAANNYVATPPRRDSHHRRPDARHPHRLHGHRLPHDERLLRRLHAELNQALMQPRT